MILQILVVEFRREPVERSTATFSHTCFWTIFG